MDYDKGQLFNIMIARLDDGDLNTICFLLSAREGLTDIRRENLDPGIEGGVRSLIARLEYRRAIPQLIEVLHTKYPYVLQGIEPVQTTRVEQPEQVPEASQSNPLSASSPPNWPRLIRQFFFNPRGAREYTDRLSDAETANLLRPVLAWILTSVSCVPLLVADIYAGFQPGFDARLYDNPSYRILSHNWIWINVVLVAIWIIVSMIDPVIFPVKTGDVLLGLAIGLSVGLAGGVAVGIITTRLSGDIASTLVGSMLGSLVALMFAGLALDLVPGKIGLLSVGVSVGIGGIMSGLIACGLAVGTGNDLIGNLILSISIIAAGGAGAAATYRYLHTPSRPSH